MAVKPDRWNIDFTKEDKGVFRELQALLFESTGVSLGLRQMVLMLIHKEIKRLRK